MFDCHLQQHGCYQPGSHEKADGVLILGNLKTVNEGLFNERTVNKVMGKI